MSRQVAIGRGSVARRTCQSYSPPVEPEGPESDGRAPHAWRIGSLDSHRGHGRCRQRALIIDALPATESGLRGMTPPMRSSAVLVLVLVVAALSVGVVRRAEAGGPKGLVLVGRGDSDGVRWSQRARADGSRVIIDSSWRAADEEPGGGISDARLNAGVPVDWVQDSHVGSADQQVLEGVAYSTVDHLRLEFADGTARKITLSRAPGAARKKWPSLGHFRFFFVALEQQPAMMRLVAVGRNSRVVMRIPLASGTSATS
jgi:hypothetical protein